MFSCIWYCSNLPAASTIPAPKFLIACVTLPIACVAKPAAEKFKIVDKSKPLPCLGFISTSGILSIAPANFLASAVVFANCASVFFSAVVSTCLVASLLVLAISVRKAAAVAFNFCWSVVTLCIVFCSVASSGLLAT